MLDKQGIRQIKITPVRTPKQRIKEQRETEQNKSRDRLREFFIKKLRMNTS
jgi:hypothetical protein